MGNYIAKMLDSLQLIAELGRFARRWHVGKTEEKLVEEMHALPTFCHCFFDIKLTSVRTLKHWEM